MTRNFEEEYKRYADSNVPDLWDRIDKAIDEKEKKKSSNKNKIIVFVSTHSGLAIAAACVLLSLGALRLIGGVGASKSEAASAPAAASESADVSYDAAPAAADHAATAEATEEAAEEAMPDMDNITGGYDEAPAAAAEAPAATAEASMKAADAPVAEAEEADNAEMAADNNMISAICILDDVSALEKDHKITVSIKDAEGSGLTKGSAIVAVIEDTLYDELSPVLKDGTGKEYEIVIEKDENTDEYRLYYAQLKK